MTHLLVVATITDRAVFQFGSAIESWARQHLPFVLQLDLDSQSDRGYVSQIAEAIAKAEAVALWVESKDEQASPGAVSILVEALLQHPRKAILLLNGPHKLLGRIGSSTDIRYKMGEAAEDLQLELLRFFTEWGR